MLHQADPSLTNPDFVPPEITPATEAQWWDVIGKFKAKVAEFESVYNKITQQKNIAAQSPTLAGEFNTWMSRAQPVKKQIDYWSGIINTAANWLRGNVLGDLAGFWFPAALVVGFIGTMAVITRDGWVFSRKMEFVEKQTAAGVSLTDAVENANKMAGGRLVPWLNIDTKYLALGAGVIGGVWLFLQWRKSSGA